MLYQGADGQKVLWPSSDIYLATSRGERFQRESGFFIRAQSGAMVPASVSAAAIPSRDMYLGAVITLRTLEALKQDIGEEIARKNRKQTRKRIGTVLRLFDRNTGMNMGRLVNISMEGFKLATRDEVSVGSRFPVSMVLPETLAGSNTMSFDAQAVWSRPAEDVPGEHRVGFRIVRINENDLRALLQLIEKY